MKQKVLKKVSGKVEKILVTICFGKPAKGEKLPDPTFKTLLPPSDRPTVTEWANEYKFGCVHNRPAVYIEL
jgi:hypothetical protein